VSAALPGWWILMACGPAVLVLGLLTTGPWARGTAERTARRLETVRARDGVVSAHSRPWPTGHRLANSL
jgi:hypothetical protein